MAHTDQIAQGLSGTLPHGRSAVAAPTEQQMGGINTWLDQESPAFGLGGVDERPNPHRDRRKRVRRLLGGLFGGAEGGRRLPGQSTGLFGP